MKINKKVIFKGCATALITPFSDGLIDYKSLSAIIDMQISGGVSALVVGGTTGEAATLSDEERYELYGFAKEYIRGRVPLIVGTGTNDTRVAMKHTKFASELGCDAALLVTPYYNKGTEEGVYRHYSSIADTCDIPLMLYNVPSRTGVNLGINLISRLAKHENIVAIKEATDSLDRLVEISSLGEQIALYSGNDSQIYPTLALGGLGVISVASNILPKEMSDICSLWFSGRYEESLAIQKQLLPFIKSLFIETNPAPIKYAMSLAGYCSSEVRLPLSLPRESTLSKVKEELFKL